MDTIYLLFPGRHLVNTRFQERYLTQILSQAPATLPGFTAGRTVLSRPPAVVLFAITSANQENSRYNPIPFHVRAIGVDRFASQLQAKVSFAFRIFGVPHYGHTQNFAAFTIKEIAHQSERAVRLTPENCLVLCSTPEVIRLYQEIGFSIAPAEQAELDPRPPTPIEIIRQIGESSGPWQAGALVSTQLATSHVQLFKDFPEVPLRIARLYQDPLTNQEGSLTDTRNYSTYARGMNEIVRLKYLDIRNGIRPGRIADEGCADGALLAEVSREFPDSDLFGIDLSAEFAGRFHERQRSGEFGSAYVHFFHRNLLAQIFEPSSIDTTICNSTLHELWSYGERARSVQGYLAEKFRQLAPEGRLIIRDVVGPADGDTEVLLWCSSSDGVTLQDDELTTHSGREMDWLERLSTRTRFELFTRDFLRGREAFRYGMAHHDGQSVFRLKLRQAAEFLSKKDYTDNWSSEMNEEFCFWSFARWKEVLTSLGFRVLENPNEPAASSRVYVNPWVVKNRYEGHVRLLSPQGTAMEWPPTNMVLVAEKPVREATG